MKKQSKLPPWTCKETLGVLALACQAIWEMDSHSMQFFQDDEMTKAFILGMAHAEQILGQKAIKL